MNDLFPTPKMPSASHSPQPVFFNLYTLYTFGKFGPPYPGQATAASRAALPSPTSACWVFSCFRNPPNSDMDHRIFNVRRPTWSFLCAACVYTGGLGTPTTSQHNIFDSEKLSHFGVLLTGFEARVFGSRVRRSTHWATLSPLSIYLCLCPLTRRVVGAPSLTSQPAASICVCVFHSPLWLWGVRPTLRRCLPTASFVFPFFP